MCDSSQVAERIEPIADETLRSRERSTDSLKDDLINLYLQLTIVKLPVDANIRPKMFSVNGMFGEETR